MMGQLSAQSPRLGALGNLTGFPLIAPRRHVQDVTRINNLTGKIGVENEPQKIVLPRRNIDEAKADSAMVFGDIANLRIDGQGEFVAAEWKNQDEVKHAAGSDIQRA